MECNKDEAIRAKMLSEKKFTENDIAGAKRFSLKAQNLFPGLEGLSQLQVMLDIYVASQKKVNGEVDWYEIFGVDPLADVDTIRKKYRKLALTLHPDKNKSVGADGAFNLISEGWSLLSDKGKRDAYNEKRNIRASYQKARGGAPPAGAGNKNSSSSSSKQRNPTARDKSQQDMKASFKKATGYPPARAGKSCNTNFTSSSSSTINPANRDKSQQNTRPSDQKARSGNPSTGAGKSSSNNFTANSSNTINPATPENPQQDTRASYQKAKDRNPPATAGKSGCNTFSNSKSGTRNPTTPEYSQTVRVASSANPKTFWTSCKTCNVQYEYVRIYLNQRLLCPNCRKPFLANEMPPPHGTSHKSSTKGPLKRKQQAAENNVFNTSSASGGKSMGTSNFSGFNSSIADSPPGSSSKSNGARNQSISVTAAGHAAQHFKSTDESLKKGHEGRVTDAVNERSLWEKSTASRRADSDSGLVFGKEEGATKKRCINERDSHVGEKKVANRMELEGGDNEQRDMSGNQVGGFGRGKVNISGSKKLKISRDFSQTETHTMLMETAKMEILKKKSESGLAALTKFSGEVCGDVENINAAFEDANCSDQPSNSLLFPVTTNSDTEATKTLTMAAPVVSGEFKESSPFEAMVDGKSTKTLIMVVPDSDFVDFDKDRAEGSFAENQVWAAYDDEDGMPRVYAVVRGVTSGHPSRVKVSWLKSKSNPEIGTLNCIGCGFSRTWGDFRISRREVDEALNSFSHRVKCAKSAGGVIDIFPRKRDVWALYRNWSRYWNELTPDDVIRQYDVVEVLGDYNEEHGVPVAKLVKVAGFKSVFHRHLDPGKIYTIPREEMFRFSHQVPSCLLTGHGDKRALSGCWELDPAAMPDELLRVIEEPLEEEANSTLKIGKDAQGAAEVGEDGGTT